MGRQGHELDAKLAQAVHEAGGLVTYRGVTSGNHNVLKYDLGDGQDRQYFYAKTGKLNGRGIKNAVAQLRKQIREQLQTIDPAHRRGPVEKPVAAVPMVEKAVGATPPSSTKITAARRKEMLKRYLSMDSIEEFMEEFDLTRPAAEIMIRSQKGQATHKFEKELARKRSANQAPQVLKAVEPPPGRYAARGKRYGTAEETAKRNHRIRTYCKFGLTVNEAASLFDLTPARVYQILKEGELENVG